MNRNRAFLLLLLAAFGVLSALIVRPYLQFVLLGGLFAYILRPLQRRLAPHVGPRVAAGSLMAWTILLILIPLGVLLGVVFRQALSLVDSIRAGQINLHLAEAYIQAYFGVAVDIESALRSAIPNGEDAILGNALGIVGGLSDLVVGLAVFFFVLYYLLKDGHKLVAWLEHVAPLPADVQSNLFERVDRLMWAVLVGNLLVAVVQGVLTGIGFLAVGLPGAIFWTVMTTVLSLLPLIGASVVWIPAAGYLFFTGQTIPAVGLFVYGTFVVSLSDNYLRPLIGGYEGKLNPGVFIVGIFGGVALFGFVGLFYGPIVLGVLKALVDTTVEVRDRREFIDTSTE